MHCTHQAVASDSPSCVAPVLSGGAFLRFGLCAAHIQPVRKRAAHPRMRRMSHIPRLRDRACMRVGRHVDVETMMSTRGRDEAGAHAGRRRAFHPNER